MFTERKKKKEFHSGEKLKLAISLKGYSIQEVADKLGVQYGAIQQMQHRGFKRKISSVSGFFQVDDWVFNDDYPDRETFKKII
jgi:transcriptional regulator with XRE-family HTH domain